MFYYGFLIENNKSNAVYIKLYINKDDKLGNTKRKMIGNTEGYSIKSFKYFEDFKTNSDKNKKFLGYLRFIEFDKNLKDLCKYLNPQISNPETCKSIRRKLRMTSISKENEKLMLRKLKEIATKCLSKFPDTYEKDIELLSNKSLSYNERNCIIYRSGEKKVNLLALLCRFTKE